MTKVRQEFLALRPPFDLLIDESRRATRMSGQQLTKGFLDCLQTSVHASFDEITKWIAVARYDATAMTFTVQEIVDVELMSNHFADMNRLRVNSTAKATIQGRPIQKVILKGSIIGLFEDIIHNLLSNAFNHSGLGLATTIDISVSISDQTLSIRCVNSMSAQTAELLQKKLPRLRKLASDNVPERAKKEKLSGFQKIRHSARRLSKGDVTFNIPPIVSRGQGFAIEIEMRDMGEILA